MNDGENQSSSRFLNAKLINNGRLGEGLNIGGSPLP